MKTYRREDLIIIARTQSPTNLVGIIGKLGGSVTKSTFRQSTGALVNRIMALQEAFAIKQGETMQIAENIKQGIHSADVSWWRC